jgi:hypothetical protein
LGFDETWEIGKMEKLGKHASNVVWEPNCTLGKYLGKTRESKGTA